MTGVTVCGGVVAYRRHILPCWGRCNGKRRRVVSAWDASPYYGPTYICCHCGDRWSDGELLERPFARGWREPTIQRAKKRWAESPSGPVRRVGLYVLPDVDNPKA